MDLFGFDADLNILPYDGDVYYYGGILEYDFAKQIRLDLLQNIAWKNDEVVIHGKHIITDRKIAWYGDKPYSYTYSNTTKQAHVWTAELLQLKQIVEKHTNAVFNSCLLNLYHTGAEGLSWHSDNEKELGKNSVIASLSLGAKRKFSFKHKQSRETVSLELEEGSLLLMKGGTQQHWLHSLPKTTKVHEPRINLTFRQML
ncbi:alpha-ketoglutarate-dependent dioxygenase AlkB [Cocleimonas sp. KMM 6892]|uniref:alpha-ketoglutarate-dependent dioxygenase AlkB family protein n=1 Tax=unclassified Cocleimonas TaxID=2639732 RepID=UPI002DB88E58|nr:MULTISPECIES: alpha-ketoglutarate-dependent dioxygenase AlkB [unclassified Cocleimonas]MEB8432507.1 alpha-ketoglutarate-dependent dioxygenase AlkB [Cocleimonas sp. KMM 6892]MEC4715366.1 alpha-ketoglutarate-dependent dioxygenase AlkB [Cocleimonas sp. KMM 6895]MEC4745015.1 alpha-ketoglutarate-dependent dioxygenase AlkB [Cocleimonas sp. KMM 6896]